MVTQRCALTVQLQPFITHIPGLLASTMHIRNVRYHRNTEHTIARSHLISPSKALNTLRLALIATIPDRAVRSSPADQRWFLASFITIRPLPLQNSTFARSDSNEPIDSSILKTLRLQVSPTCILYPLAISSTDRFRVRTRREVHLFPLSISVTINIPRCVEGTGRQLYSRRGGLSLDTRAVGSSLCSKETRKKEEVVG